jgi:hypothetical protein
MHVYTQIKYPPLRYRKGGQKSRGDCRITPLMATKAQSQETTPKAQS